MKQFVCTTCPNGCSLTIDEKTLKVTGNKCPRGEAFAKNEITCPKRTVCSSVKTTIKGFNVVSVRTNKEIDKKLIPQLMKELKNTTVNKKLPIGSIVIKNVLNTDVDIITTKDMQ